MIDEEITEYDLEYMGVKCIGVRWSYEKGNLFYFMKDKMIYSFSQDKYVDSSADTDHIRIVIAEQFLPWWTDNRIKELETENEELRERLKKSIETPFIVIDKKTGKEADICKIALRENWAKGLIYCDMEGFAISQEGELILMDECDHIVYCPNDRFEIISEARIAELKGDK